MNRQQFISSLGLAGTGALLAPNEIFGQDRPAAYQREVVQKFVSASHRDLDEVKEWLEEFPNLIYASNDWGGGDFETGVGAGGHVGHKDMVNFLISKGARPTLHALTMLGKTNLVKPMMEQFPELLNCLGPHGFTFLHHAKRGGTDAQELVAYFEEKGHTKTKVSLY